MKALQRRALQQLDGEEPVAEIIIERDYSRGTLPQFEVNFPAELAGRVSQEDFERTVQTVNQLFYDAEDLTLISCLESCFACFTFYSYYMCFDGRYKKNLKILDEFLLNENNRVYKKQGLLFVNPRPNGLLYLQILDFRKPSL